VGRWLGNGRRRRRGWEVQRGDGPLVGVYHGVGSLVHGVEFRKIVAAFVFIGQVDEEVRGGAREVCQEFHVVPADGAVHFAQEAM